MASPSSLDSNILEKRLARAHVELLMLSARSGISISISIFRMDGKLEMTQKREGSKIVGEVVGGDDGDDGDESGDGDDACLIVMVMVVVMVVVMVLMMMVVIVVISLCCSFVVWLLLVDGKMVTNTVRKAPIHQTHHCFESFPRPFTLHSIPRRLLLDTAIAALQPALQSGPSDSGKVNANLWPVIYQHLCCTFDSLTKYQICTSQQILFKQNRYAHGFGQTPTELKKVSVSLARDVHAVIKTDRCMNTLSSSSHLHPQPHSLPPPHSHPTQSVSLSLFYAMT
jgi:hypothetical protein